MKNKKMILAIVAVVVVIALAVGLYFATRPSATAGGKAFTVTVVHADGSTKDFKYNSDAEFLGEALLAEGLVSGENSDFGLYITKVDGEEAIYETDNAYWSFYVGEEYAQLGVDQTPIEDGAVYKLVYTPA